MIRRLSAPADGRPGDVRGWATFADALPELAARSPVRIPNESAEYRAARTALLKEEYELRRQLERVAAMRRTLPPGGEVTGDYKFIGENGASDFAGLFGDKDTLILYSFMFGPQRERPCPMCTNLLGPLAANAADSDFANNRSARSVGASRE